MLSRFAQDQERRDLALKLKREQQRAKKEEELKGLFKPKILPYRKKNVNLSMQSDISHLTTASEHRQQDQNPLKPAYAPHTLSMIHSKVQQIAAAAQPPPTAPRSQGLITT